MTTLDEQPEARPNTRRRPRPARWSTGVIAWLVLLGAGAAASAFLLHEGRQTTFLLDEWNWILDRRGWEPSAFILPHNGHLSVVPVAVYKVLFATVGLEHYGVYRLVGLLGHLLCVLLVFLYGRGRVGPVLALVAAVLVLTFGPAWQDVLWPFQIAWFSAMAAGIGAFMSLDRCQRRFDVLAMVLVAVALGSTGLGLSVLLAVIVDVALSRRTWRDAWIVGVPLALYLAWYARWSDTGWIDVLKQSGVGHPVVSGLLHVPRFLAASAASSLASVTGTGGSVGPGGDEATSMLAYGAPLLVVALAGLVWVAARRGLSARIVALVTLIASFWALTGFSRWYLVDPWASRYLYPGAVGVLLIATELARGRRPQAPVLAVVGVLALFAVVSNLLAFQDGGKTLRGEARATVSSVTALSIARPVVPATFETGELKTIVAGPYFAAADALGSPAVAPDAVPTLPPDTLRQVDARLVGMEGLRLSPATGRTAPRPPAVAAVTGGTVRRTAGCLVFRPGLRVGSAAPTLDVLLPAAGLRLERPGRELQVGVRRFGTVLTGLGLVAGPGAAQLIAPADLAPNRPWRVQLQPQGATTVCARAA